MTRRRAPELNPSPGIVSAVAPGSIAEDLGIQAGDRIHSVNGHLLRDIIDYRFYAAEDNIRLLASTVEGELEYEVSRDYGKDLGIEFAMPTFDGIRRCQCRCAFCFVHQMPSGLRKSLYVRDDDYRYSFLFGNFVTLTNLIQEDWDRLEEQRLSPLYVSVHTTDLELRRQLLGHPSAPDIVAQIRGLGSAGIHVHAQIVLVPGLNDGDALGKTIEDLARLYPIVESIAIVPVGLTRYHRRGLGKPTASEAAELVRLMADRQSTFRKVIGRGLIYLSDEIYLQAELPVPAADEYDGFPHLENGVGLTRCLLDEWSELEPRAHTLRPSYAKATVVCGTLIGPTIERLLSKMGDAAGIQYSVAPVINRFFGASITVSGLLTGQDVLQALRRRALGDIVILPRVMFDASGNNTLDDLSLTHIEQELGSRVSVASSLEQLLLI